MAFIGNSDLDVYPLCLGTNTFGWTASEDESYQILNEYTEAGGNFVDTADVYSEWKEGNKGGESETIIGKWMAGVPREEMVIATKVAMHPRHRGLSESNIRYCADASLTRLRTDYIDLYYAHEPDDAVPVAESVAAFAALQQAGKIRQVGLSNFSPDQVRAWLAEADRQDVAAPVALQPRYNLVWRRKFEQGLMPLALKHNLGVMPYFSLAAGFLSGKYISLDQAVGERGLAVASHATPEAFAAVEALRVIADEHNVEPSSVAIAWLLTRPTIVAPIASASRVGQVSPLLEGVSITLSDDQLETLDRLSAGLGDLDKQG